MKRYAILPVLVFSCIVGYSQISTEENPVSFQR